MAMNRFTTVGVAMTCITTSQTVLAGAIGVPEDHATIQAAIIAAQDGDEILVSPGTYTEHLVLLGKDIILRSTDGPDVTVIDPEILAETGPVISAVNGETNETLVQGFTITGGLSDTGGGFRIIDASISIRDCYIINNEALQGGGIYAINAVQLFIEGCTFQGNTALNTGGGLWADSSTFPGGLPPAIQMINAVFNGNHAGLAGAVYCDLAGVQAVNSSFGGNSSDTNAGAIAIQAGQANVINCAFGENFDGSAAQFTRDFWVSDEGFLAVSHVCTPFVEESDGSSPGFGVITLGPNVFTTAGPLDFASPFVNVLGDDGLPGTGDENFDLSPDSLCIDTGNNTVLPFFIETDVAGNPRFVDDPQTPDFGVGRAPFVDMGAFEFQADLSPGDFDGDGVVGPEDLAALLGWWGPCPALGHEICIQFDLTGDFEVGPADLAILLGNWG